MKANELRIGNYVDNNVECFKLKAKDLVFLFAFDNQHYANPIPLTEEWLLGFGFEYDHVFYTKGLLNLCPNRNGNYTPYIHTLTHGRLELNVEYVHQLQNLYFALTGDELVRR